MFQDFVLLSESGFIDNEDGWRDQGHQKDECAARGGIDGLYHRSPPALDNSTTAITAVKIDS
jgi:hypothetical protein